MQGPGIFPPDPDLDGCDGTSRVSCNSWITGEPLSQGRQGFAWEVIRQWRRLVMGGLFLPWILGPRLYGLHRMSCQAQVADWIWPWSWMGEWSGIKTKGQEVTHAQRCSLQSSLFYREYSLLADMRGRHQPLDEVIQPHFSLLDESCTWTQTEREREGSIYTSVWKMITHIANIFLTLQEIFLLCIDL